jgi:heterodisulfide reductase subunit B
MKYGYFPGCSLESTSREYDTSLRAVYEKLGIELLEIENWICCGSSAVHIAPRRLAVALPAQNLAYAQQQGFEEVVAPCAACFARFKSAQNELTQHPELIPEVEGIIGQTITNTVKVLHPLELLSEDLLKMASQLSNNALAGLKVVCYYGCLLTRPPKVTHFDDVENPMSMDRLMSALGASVMNWDHKTDCCGGFFALVKPEIVLRLSREILESASQAGAQAIVVACPLCQVNLDTRQAEINQAYHTQFNIPIIYFTQLMGLAFNVPQTELRLESHFVKARALIEKVAAL